MEGRGYVLFCGEVIVIVVVVAVVVVWVGNFFKRDGEL